MTGLVLMLMMQYVISTKAGLVNYVQGNVNVAVGDSVAAGAPIKTGPGAFAEVLLNPGSFLRMAENSEVVLDRIELSDVAVTIVSGAVVIEASEVFKHYPLKIMTGNLSVLIVQNGVYKFENGKATVIEGSLETADSRIPYKKGWSVVSIDDVYRSLKIAKNAPETALEQWSEARSTLMLAANIHTYQTFRRAGIMTSASTSSWMWAPSFGAYTFFPGYRIRSAYGHNNYASYNEVNGGNGSFSVNNRSNSDSSGAGAASRDSSGSGSSGGSGGSGGGYSPANDRPTVRESIQMKNAPVPPPPGGPGGNN